MFNILDVCYLEKNENLSKWIKHICNIFFQIKKTGH